MTGLTAVRVICGLLLVVCIGLTIGLVLVASNASNDHNTQAQEINTLRTEPDRV
jgi:uncharacterized membrane protein YraQ (UPF0718 family)